MNSQVSNCVAYILLITLALIGIGLGCPCKQCECVNCENYEHDCTTAAIWNTENVIIRPNATQNPLEIELDQAMAEVERLKSTLQTIKSRLRIEIDKVDALNADLSAKTRASNLMVLINRSRRRD